MVFGFVVYDWFKRIILGVSLLRLVSYDIIMDLRVYCGKKC